MAIDLRWRKALVLTAGLLLWIGGSLATQAQTRYGGGLQLTGSTTARGLGPALHVRASFPMNREFSLGFGGAFTGFRFGGGKKKAYALDANASLIVTLPNPTRSSLYLLGGAGYHVPFGPRYADPTAVSGKLEVKSGPTFHVGLGKVWQFSALSLYVELVPSLFFRRARSDLLLPFRAGIIL